MDSCVPCPLQVPFVVPLGILALQACALCTVRVHRQGGCAFRLRRQSAAPRPAQRIRGEEAVLRVVGAHCLCRRDRLATGDCGRILGGAAAIVDIYVRAGVAYRQDFHEDFCILT